jgi:O-acetyl-ADP-ribose deacetylase (regulator of RNase III)
MQTLCSATLATGVSIDVCKGSWTQCGTQAVTNAANSQLRHMGGIAASIAEVRDKRVA